MDGNTGPVVEAERRAMESSSHKKEYCRICLIKFERRFMIPIFSVETKRLEHQIRSVVTSIEMSPQDQYSKCICIECALKVSTSFNFMEFCQENQKLLRSPLFSENLLVEATDNPQDTPIIPPHLSPPPPLERRHSGGGNLQLEVAPSQISPHHLPPPPPLTSRRSTISQQSPQRNTPPTSTPSTTSNVPTTEEATQEPPAEEDDEESQMTISSMLECQLNEGEDEEQTPRVLDLPFFPPGDLNGIPPNNPYKCTVCFREFGKKANVLSHFQTQHTSLEVPSAWKYEIEPAKCPLCGLLVECLFAHLEHHAGRRTFKCESCEWAFYSKNYLSIHTAKLHRADAAIDARPDRFTCKQCPGGSHVCRDYDDLVAHYRQWHLNEMKNKLETCTLCNRETRYLKVHMEKMHNTNQGQFQCNLCDKSYAKARYLQSHFTTAHKDHQMNQNPPPVDYSMGNNQQGAPQQPPKQQQQKTNNNNQPAKRPRVHPGGPVHCVKCQMQFPNNRMLNMHIQRYHNANIHHPVTTAEVSVTAIPAAGPLSQQLPENGMNGVKPPKKRRRDSVPVMGDLWNQSAITGMLVNMFNGKGHYED